MSGVLVVGYGSPLRGDDAVGWRAVERLAADPRLAGSEVLALHQLTPELAEDVGRAQTVVFVDAAVTQEPGSVAVEPVVPAPAGCPAAWSHHAGPAALLSLARMLFGAAPPAVLVTVGAASFGPGEGLSPAVEQAVPRVCDTVAALVAASASARRAAPAGPPRSQARRLHPLAHRAFRAPRALLSSLDPVP